MGYIAALLVKLRPPGCLQCCRLTLRTLRLINLFALCVEAELSHAFLRFLLVGCVQLGTEQTQQLHGGLALLLLKLIKPRLSLSDARGCHHDRSLGGH